MDKLIRFALLPRGGEPVIWDFGSAAKHHQLYNPWLDYDRDPGSASCRRRRAPGSRARGRASRRCAAPSTPTPASPRRSLARSPTVLREHGLADEPLGVDLVEMPILAALQAEGIDVVDGQQVFLEARRIKTADEIALLTQACSMVDAAYDELYALPAARGARERVRRAGQQGALRPRQRVRRGRQRHLRRALLAAPARVQRPDRPPGRPGVLRHPAQPPRLPHLLLPLLRGRQRLAGDARRLHPLPRVHGPSRSRWCGPGATTADIVSLWPTAAGVRLPRRGGGVRPAVRPRRRPVDLGEADLQPAGLARPPRDARGGHGLRARDVLAGRRRLVGRPDRGGGRRHRRRLRGDHQVPGRGAAGRRPALLDGRRRAAARPRVAVAPQHRRPDGASDDRRGTTAPVRRRRAARAGTSRWR